MAAVLLSNVGGRVHHCQRPRKCRLLAAEDRSSMPWFHPVLSRGQRRRVCDLCCRHQQAGNAADLLHSFAAQLLLQSGDDIRTAQDLLGHADLATTMIYTRVLSVGSGEVRSPMNGLNST